MTFQEATKCFEDEVLKVWPSWTPNDKERSHWILVLQKYEIAEVKKALFLYHQQYDLFGKPKMPKFLAITRTLIFKRKRVDKPQIPLFWLVRWRDGQMSAVYGEAGRFYSPDQIDAMAKKESENRSETYAEKWFVVKSNDPKLRSKQPNGLYPVAVLEEGEQVIDDDDIFETTAEDDEGEVFVDYEKNPEYDPDCKPDEDSDCPF